MEIKLAGRGSLWIVDTPAGRIRMEGLRELDAREAELAAFLPPFAGHVLVALAEGSPVIPALVATLNPQTAVEVFEPDLHDARLQREKLALLPNVTVTCAADPAPAATAPQAGILLLRDLTDRLLAFDLIERFDHILPPGSPVLVLIPAKRIGDFGRKLEQHLRKRHILCHEHKKAIVWLGQTGGDPTAWTPRLCEFTASTPTEEVRLCSRPGVFCHGRPDTGGLALAEKAEVRPDQRVLDLGCGCGLTGLLLAERMRRAGGVTGHVLLVDSHVRAVDCARRGAELNGLDFVTVEHSDVCHPEAAAFDVVTANPPYYADHRICEFFIHVAARALKPDGTLWLVSKHGKIVAEMADAYGLRAETIRRRNYDISVCRPRTPGGTR